MIRVLVVDDDPDIRQLVTFALNDEGYEVDEASDGAVALEIISRRPPEIILLDMKMPGMDGWEFARLYRQRHDVRSSIIVLTAAQDAARWAREIDADSYVAKPFDVKSLVECVLVIADKHRSKPSS
jgi:DNA-binding response OmpR family regulator